MPKKVVSSKKSVVSNKASGVKTTSYENTMEEFFVKTMPSLPEGVKEFIVNFSPWIVLVMLVLMLPAVLTVFGLGAMMAPYGYMMGARWGYGYSLTWVISLISFGLTLWAMPGLFRRQMFSWRLMFYSVLVTAVGTLLSGQLVSLIVGTGVSLYFLYQVKSYYK